MMRLPSWMMGPDSSLTSESLRASLSSIAPYSTPIFSTTSAKPATTRRRRPWRTSRGYPARGPGGGRPACRSSPGSSPGVRPRTGLAKATRKQIPHHADRQDEVFLAEVLRDALEGRARHLVVGDVVAGRGRGRAPWPPGTGRASPYSRPGEGGRGRRHSGPGGGPRSGLGPPPSAGPSRSACRRSRTGLLPKRHGRVPVRPSA